MSAAATTDVAMTKEEQKVFDKARASSFRGSIAVMVIYGVFILVLGMVGVLSPTGRTFIFEENFAFTVTFIGGTLLVIILLLVQLLTYKTPKRSVVETDSLACPDFWELKKTDPAYLTENKINRDVQPWAKYYCAPKAGLVGIGTTHLVGIGTDTTLDSNYTDMVVKFNNAGGLSTGALITEVNARMTCNRIYPEYMNYMDNKAYPDEPNTLRCKFIEQCNGAANVGKGAKISWLSVCPAQN